MILLLLFMPPNGTRLAAERDRRLQVSSRIRSLRDARPRASQAQGIAGSEFRMGECTIPAAGPLPCSREPNAFTVRLGVTRPRWLGSLAAYDKIDAA